MRYSERRSRLGMRGELVLAIAPTTTVLLVLGLVEWISRHQLLYASLASSAFLIYLDPGHAVNRVVTLVLSQMMAAAAGLATFLLLGPGYLSAGLAMLATILAMVTLDLMHPPAVATSLSFGLRASDESNLALFAAAVGLTAILVVLQIAGLRTLAWLLRKKKRPIE